MDAPRVIIVEDDSDLLAVMIKALSGQGLAVEGVASALDFYRAYALHGCEVAILDLGLPDQDGLEIARTLSRQNDIGIVVLTARSRLEDRIDGFKSGANVYFSKPVDVRELAAAVHSLARTIRNQPGMNGPPQAPRQWRLGMSSHILVTPDGASMTLSMHEVRMMRRLAEANGGAVTRDDLLRAIGHDPLVCDRQLLDAAIRRLRHKAEGELQASLPLKTVQGIGYRFAADIRIIDR